MRTIQTLAYSYLLIDSAKKERKYPEYDPNPWAVCTETVGRENDDKYERCVKHVKDKADVVEPVKR